MSRFESGGKNPEGRYHRKINAVPHGDNDVAGIGIHRLDFRVTRRIDFPDPGALIDDLGLVITKAIHLVRNFLVGRLTHDDTHQFLAPKLYATYRDRARRTALIGERIITVTSPHDRRLESACFGGDRLNERSCHGNLMDAVLRQRNTNRVTNSVGEQAADSDGTLNATILAVASLGDTKMDRIVPIRSLSSQPRHEQTVCFDHDFRIAGLHRKDEVVVAKVASNAGKLEGALDHSERRVPIAVHDAIAQAAVVGTDAHGDTPVLAQFNKRRKFLPDSIEFLVVFIIRVFTDGEFLLVRIIARIDAHLFHPFCRLHCSFRLEMNVGHQRDVAISGAEAIDNMLKVRSVSYGWRGDTHDLTADSDEIERLTDGFRGIHRVAGDHGLYADRITAAHTNFADAHLPCRAPRIRVKTAAILQAHLVCSGDSFGRVAKISPTSKKVT